MQISNFVSLAAAVTSVVFAVRCECQAGDQKELANYACRRECFGIVASPLKRPDQTVLTIERVMKGRMSRLPISREVRLFQGSQYIRFGEHINSMPTGKVRDESRLSPSSTNIMFHLKALSSTPKPETQYYRFGNAIGTTVDIVAAAIVLSSSHLACRDCGGRLRCARCEVLNPSWSTP